MIIIGIDIVCSWWMPIIGIVTMLITGPTFNKGLEKYPHPGRKSGYPGREIAFERGPNGWSFKKLGEFALDLIALAFSSQEIAQPVKRLHDAHRGSPRPEQLAGGGRPKCDRDIAELDRTAAGKYGGFQIERAVPMSEIRRYFSDIWKRCCPKNVGNVRTQRIFPDAINLSVCHHEASLCDCVDTSCLWVLVRRG